MNNNPAKPDDTNDDFRRKYERVRVIVLGSTGFIGRWVARGLCDAGAEVILLVRNRVAAEAVFNEFDISGDVYELDLLDAQSVRLLYREIRPTVTFNLAGYGVDREEHNEELAYRTNVDLIGTVCSAVGEVRDHEWAGPNLVNVGSAMEYGQTEGNLAEDSDAKPTTLYAKSKLAGTKVLTDCSRSYGVKGLTARLFSVYGPGEPPQRLLPTLIRAVGDGTPIPLTAGLHKRDFVYVEDVAESLLRLGLKASRPGDVVNVATGVLSSVRTFVETATDTLRISHERLRFGSFPTRLEEMNHEPVTVERLRALTGWVPNTMIASGIRKTLQFQRSSSPFRAPRSIELVHEEGQCNSVILK